MEPVQGCVLFPPAASASCQAGRNNGCALSRLRKKSNSSLMRSGTGPRCGRYRLTDEWDRMIDINIKGVLYGIAAALPVFEAQQRGHFINISSVAGTKVVSPGGTVYSGTKFAVRAISEGLRHEVGGSIRTTVISPGAVESELKNGSQHGDSKSFVEAFYQNNQIPADSVARAIAYAVEQPADVDINEIVLRPAVQEF